MSHIVDQRVTGLKSNMLSLKFRSPLQNNYHEESHTITKLKRCIKIAYPKNAKKLKTKFPYVLYFQPAGDHGMIGQNSDDNSSLKHVMNNLIDLGIAIVFLVPFQDDTYYCMVDGGGYEFQCNNTPNTQCWEGSIDHEYLVETMHLIYHHAFLDFDRIMVIGYSAGAQMTSLAMDKFPSSKFDNISFPTIKGAVIIAGGSQFCYAYDASQKLPIPFEPCIDPKYRLCCPRRVVEESYRGKKSCASHPPTLLCQTENDNWADPNASVFYFEEMKRCGGKAALIRTNGSYHGLTSAQIQPMTSFICNIFNISVPYNLPQSHNNNMYLMLFFGILIVFIIRSILMKR